MASTIDEGEELVPTSNVLYAAHKHIGERCKDVSTSFLKCKKKDLDPSVCLNEGKAVLGCLGTVLKDLRSSCLSEVDSYSQCLDRYR